MLHIVHVPSFLEKLVLGHDKYLINLAYTLYLIFLETDPTRLYKGDEFGGLVPYTVNTFLKALINSCTGLCKYQPPVSPPFQATPERIILKAVTKLSIFLE